MVGLQKPAATVVGTAALHAKTAAALPILFPLSKWEYQNCSYSIPYYLNVHKCLEPRVSGSMVEGWTRRHRNVADDLSPADRVHLLHCTFPPGESSCPGRLPAHGDFTPNIKRLIFLLLSDETFPCTTLSSLFPTPSSTRTAPSSRCNDMFHSEWISAGY